MSIADVTVGQLRAFVAVAEQGSFSLAATTLAISQSAVSQAIAALERQLGIGLFQRGRQGAIPTDAGKRLLGEARGALRAVEQFVAQAAESRGGTAGTLTVGTFGSVSSRILPTLVQSFRTRYPNVSLQIVEAAVDDMAGLLAAAAVDVAAVTADDLVPNLPHVLAGADAYVVVAPARRGHAAPAADIPLAELRDEPLILPKCATTSQVLAAFQRARVTPKVALQMADVPALIAMVRLGIGPAVLPRLALPDDLRGLHVRTITPRIVREIHFQIGAHARDSVLVRRFLEAVVPLVGADVKRRARRA